MYVPFQSFTFNLSNTKAAIWEVDEADSLINRSALSIDTTAHNRSVDANASIPTNLAPQESHDTATGTPILRTTTLQCPGGQCEEIIVDAVVASMLILFSA